MGIARTGHVGVSAVAILNASRMVDSIDAFYVSLLRACFPERPSPEVAAEVFLVIHVLRIHVALET
jgi:hypothetical protein